MKTKNLSMGILTILIVMLMILTGCGNKDVTDKNNDSKGENEKNANVKIGDYIEYDNGSGHTYTALASKTGYEKDQEFSTTGGEKWRVLNINDDGTIDIILDGMVATKYDSGLYLKGKTGYDNAIEVFNDICKLYGNGNFANSARCIDEKDITKLLNVDEIVKFYQNKYEKDIETAGTDEEKLENVYKFIDEYYGLEKNINGEKAKVKSRFEWKSQADYAEDGLGHFIKDDISKKLLMSKDTSKDTIWLATQTFKYSESSAKEWNDAYFGISTISVTKYPSYVSCSYYPYNVYNVRTYFSNNNTEKHENKEHAYLRPIVNINASSISKDGDGTEANPYKLK